MSALNTNQEFNRAIFDRDKQAVDVYKVKRPAKLPDDKQELFTMLCDLQQSGLTEDYKFYLGWIRSILK